MEQMERITAEVLEHPKLNNADEKSVKRYVRRSILQIKRFCNRNDLPELVEDVAAQIAEDMLKADGIIKLEKEVSSISRGDTTISYRDPSSAYQRTMEFVNDYKSQLIPFKKMKLPSDPNDERS